MARGNLPQHDMKDGMLHYVSWYYDDMVAEH